MARMTGGEALVQGLLAHGLESLFVLPGVQNDAFFSALYDAGERLRVIVTRHEQAAGYHGLRLRRGERPAGRLLRRAGAGVPQHDGGARHGLRLQRARPLPERPDPSGAASASCMSCPISSASCSA
jgi:hypothetical protein